MFRSLFKPTFLAALPATAYVAYSYGQSSSSNLSPPKLSSTLPLSQTKAPQYCSNQELHQALNKISLLLRPDQIKSDNVTIAYHTRNEFTPHEPLLDEVPKVIVYPETTEEVSNIMKVLHKYKVPVVPFSGGTSLEGHFFSTRKGVVLDTSRMNAIIRVNKDDLDVQVEPGVNWMDLNRHLEADELMIGSDCGPDGLIGGMISTNALGINASRYGAMISNVIALKVVLADGTIIKTKQRPRKLSSGYSLTQLFVGSEGTLGIITEATLKLHPIPKYETVIVGQFPTLIDSTNTVSQVYRNGIHPNAIELLDKDMMHCINYSGYFSRHWEEVPTIYFKIGGSNQTSVDQQIQQLREISMKNNCRQFIAAQNQDEGKELFEARKNAFYAILNYGKNEIDNDIRLWVTDIAVPLSKLSPVLNEIYTMVHHSGFQSVTLAHAGDANFHCDVFYRPDKKDECERLIKRMMHLGLINEGTASGEHGIGNGKREFLVQELGQGAVDLMRQIKFAVDPYCILNPDKIFQLPTK